MRQRRLFAFYTRMGSYGREAFAGVEEGRERESETLNFFFNVFYLFLG